MKTFADDKINVTEKIKFVLERVEKHRGKRRKCRKLVIFWEGLKICDFLSKGKKKTVRKRQNAE